MNRSGLTDNIKSDEYRININHSKVKNRLKRICSAVLILTMIFTFMSTNCISLCAADISDYEELKDLYKDHFKMGVVIDDTTIGDPLKDQLIQKEFNTVSIKNEDGLKKNMDWAHATSETDLPFVLDNETKTVLDWAKNNDINVRGSALVCDNCDLEIFCKDYTKKLTVDGKLDSSCLVSSDVMKARLESYIEGAVEEIYSQGYATVINVLDVVSEAVSPNMTEYDLKNNYWYQTIGPDYVYYAYKYAREAIVKKSKEYAGYYGVDAEDLIGIAAIQPKLFYSDNNEAQKDKCDAIIDLFTKEIEGHNIKEEGYVDGFSLQGHLYDITEINEYKNALERYNNSFGEVQIASLEVEQTHKGRNADNYQAQFYKKFFEQLLLERSSGINITSVTFGGLTDGDSSNKEACSLLFKNDLERKLAFDGVVCGISGDDLSPLDYEAQKLPDIYYDFEDGTKQGMQSYIMSDLSVQEDEVLEGRYALKVSERDTNSCGASILLKDFNGMTVEISAWVKSDAPEVSLYADIQGEWPQICTADTNSGKWVQIRGTYVVSNDDSNLKLYFGANATDDIYIDNVKVKMIGYGDFSTLSYSKRGDAIISSSSDVSMTPGGYSIRVSHSDINEGIYFDVSKFLGHRVSVKAFVMTNDGMVKLGLGTDDIETIAEEFAQSGEWTEISGTAYIPDDGKQKFMWIMTDGTADYYVGSVFISIADYSDDVENGVHFTKNPDGIGNLEVVEEGNNHVAKLSSRTNEQGICFEVRDYIGREVEISFDAKTSDSQISLFANVDSKKTKLCDFTAVPNKYNTYKKVLYLPKDAETLNLIVATDGNSDLYLDNVNVRLIRTTDECQVIYDLSEFDKKDVKEIVAKDSLLSKPLFDIAEEVVVYKDKTQKEIWDFEKDKVNSSITLYVGKKDPHVHTWNYSVSGKKIIATCVCEQNIDDCSYKNLKSGDEGRNLSLTLNAEESADYGKKTEPKVSFGTDAEKKAWTKAGFILPGSTESGAPTITKKYYMTNSSDKKTGNALDKFPVAAGKYVVEVIVSFENGMKDVTIPFTYTIVQKGQEAPKGLKAVKPSLIGGKDGKITGVTNKMEYSLDSGKTWKNISGTSITGLFAGKVQVRYKKTSSYTAGKIVTIKVPDGTTYIKESEAVKINDGFKLKTGKNVTVSWTKVKGADGYIVYMSYCGKGKYEIVKTVSAKSKAMVVVKKLDKKTINAKKNIKCCIVAYKMVNGKKVSIAKSLKFHMVGKNSKKATNAKKITIKKSSYSLKVGKTATLNPQTVKENSKLPILSKAHAPEFRYVSNNTKVATVSSNGKIKAKGKGSCSIYIYAINGVSKKVKVTVK